MKTNSDLQRKALYVVKVIPWLRQAARPTKHCLNNISMHIYGPQEFTRRANFAKGPSIDSQAKPLSAPLFPQYSEAEINQIMGMSRLRAYSLWSSFPDLQEPERLLGYLA